MLSKRTLLFVFVLLAALIACNLPSSAATIVPTIIPTPTIAAASNPTETLAPAPETQAPPDQADAPLPTDAPPAVGVESTVPGATIAPTLPPTATAPPLSGGVVEHFIVYGRDPIYKGGIARIGWDAPGVEYVSIAAYGVDDFKPGSWISDYDPTQLVDKDLLKVYEVLPSAGQLTIYIPPDFAHQHMILAVLPPGHDVTTITSSALGVIYPNEPGPDSTLYDFSGELAVIRDFGLDLPTIDPGGPVGMWWQFTGATRIEIARQGDNSLDMVAANLDPIGYLNFPAPDDYVGEVNFMLTATNDAGDQIMQTVTLTVN